MKSVVLGLGSNKAAGKLTSIDLLRGALKELRSRFPSLHSSSVYKTRPMYFTHQTDFLNMAAVFETEDDMDARDLLIFTQEIERKYYRNREKEMRNGPRTIDIDIELFGEESINEANLVIPHPRLFERAFVLIPALQASRGNERLEKLFLSYLSALSAEEKATVVKTDFVI